MGDNTSEGRAEAKAKTAANAKIEAKTKATTKATKNLLTGHQQMPLTGFGNAAVPMVYRVTLDNFRDSTSPTVQRIKAYVEHSLQLAQPRDTLLPKLNSGEIRVRGAEALVGEAR